MSTVLANQGSAPPSANGSILSVSDLRTGFGVHAVLHGVGFEVPEGEITAILGLNGAGKSVTLKTVSGLIPAWSGAIRFKGEDITALETEDRVARGMAHVLQGRAVFPHLTVEENLRLGGAVIKDKAAVAAAIERVYATFPRLGERRSQLGGNLSGGEQEMLAVGRALMSSPTLILVDEASQGLAPIAVEHLFQTLKEVNRSGVTMLMVEQNVSFTLGIADRVLVMQKGEMVYEGAGDSLDRERLGVLLGIGALIGKKVLGEKTRGSVAPTVRVTKKRTLAKRAPAAGGKKKSDGGRAAVNHRAAARTAAAKNRAAARTAAAAPKKRPVTKKRSVRR